MYRRDECSVFGDRDGSIRLMALRSLSRVSCADFDVASCVACQNLCGASASQVVYLAVFETGCQSWVEDTSVGFFTATLMIFQHRSSKTYRYTEEDFATF